MKTWKFGAVLTGLGLLVGWAGCGGNTTTGPSRGGFSSFNSGFGSDYGSVSSGTHRPGAPTSLPTAEAKKSREDRVIRDLRVQGHLAFGVTQNSLLTLDFSNPAQPKPVSQLPLPGHARALDVTQTHAYVACGAGGLQVVDVTTPAKPKKVDAWEPDLDTQQVQAVAVQNGIAYLAVQSAGLVVVDVSDPKNVKASTAFSEVSDAQRVVAAGPRVYLLEPGLTILDVADPAQPKKLDELGAQRQTYDLGLWKDYVVTLTSLGLQVLDLRDLEKVRRVAQYETGTPSPPPTGSASEAVEASATTPAAETLASQTAGRSAEAAKKAAAASGKASTSPARSGESAAPPTAPKPPAQNRRVALYGHYAYIARAGEGLWIVDVEGQEDLKRVGAVTDLGTVECCAISGQSALVGNQEGGITILDLKDPQEPKVLGRFEVQGK